MRVILYAHKTFLFPQKSLHSLTKGLKYSVPPTSYFHHQFISEHTSEQIKTCKKQNKTKKKH